LPASPTNPAIPASFTKLLRVSFIVTAS